jgi:hypothetical protein
MAWCPLPVWSCAALATAIKNEGWLPLGGRIVRAVGQRVTGPLTLGFEMCRVRALAYFRRKSSALREVKKIITRRSPSRDSDKMSSFHYDGPRNVLCTPAPMSPNVHIQPTPEPTPCSTQSESSGRFAFQVPVGLIWPTGSPGLSVRACTNTTPPAPR